MSDRTRRAIERAMRRRAGASPEHARRIGEQFRQFSDLHAYCRRCQFTFRGSFNDVMSGCPKCGWGGKP